MGAIQTAVPYVAVSGGTFTGSVIVDGNLDAATGITVASGAVVCEGTALVQKQSATPVAGTALINGTQTICTWTTPNDGLLHRVLAFGSLNVTSGQTGGVVNFSGVIPSLGTANDALFAGGQAIGSYMGFGPAAIVGPNQTVTINQATALTAGAAVIYAEIWGS